MAGWQNSFASALMDAERPTPDILRAWNGSDPARRFAVYRNNVAVNLVDGLCEKFPVCHEIVGEEFFRAMAHLFVREQPPKSRIIAEYGDDLSEFIDEFPPAKDVPYLADVARLEALRVAAYHAGDANSLSLEEWSLIPQDKLPLGQLVLHPSVQTLSSNYAVYSVWAAHQGALKLGQVDPSEPEDVLIVRAQLDVEVSLLPPGGAAFLAALMSNATLGDAAGIAAATAAGASVEFDLAANLGMIMQKGLAISVNTQSRSS